jgi:hypothetical protein
MGHNLFLQLAEIPQPKLPPRVYALLDQADVLDDGRTRFLFDSVDADWFDQHGGGMFAERAPPPHNHLDYFHHAPVFVLQWDWNPFAPPPPLASLRLNGPHSADDDEWMRPLEQNWIELALQAGAPESDTQLFYNLFAEPIPIAVTRASGLAPQIDMALKNTDPLAPFPDSTVPDIAHEIGRATAGHSIEWLGVYDVGQGNCAGLTAGGRVLLYADFGGGVLANKKTFPGALTSFCFCGGRQPPVVLSHWDWDHWSSANRDTRAQQSTWIVPRQKPLGHVHGTFIAAVAGAGGHFLVWPKGGAKCSTGQISIDQCTGSTRNDSGLALTVAPAGGGDPVLLPGDATYRHVPSGLGTTFESIVCPHHGGKMHGAKAPRSPGNGYSRLGYSYGKGNRYKHPIRATRREHDKKGWHDPVIARHPNPLVRETAKRSNTGLGHIAVGWTLWNRPPSVACSGACQLQPQQT